MRHEDMQYTVVMDDGAESVVLGRLADLDLGGAAYMAAITKHPLRNVYLRQGARTLKQNLGEPAPLIVPPPDPDLRSWSVHLIRGRRLELLGYIDAVDEAAATGKAIDLFSLTEAQRKRLAVNPRQS
jgi:hypothetical protein